MKLFGVYAWPASYSWSPEKNGSPLPLPVPRRRQFQRGKPTHRAIWDACSRVCAPFSSRFVFFPEQSLQSVCVCSLRRNRLCCTSSLLADRHVGSRKRRHDGTDLFTSYFDPAYACSIDIIHRPFFTILHVLKSKHLLEPMADSMAELGSWSINLQEPAMTPIHAVSAFSHIPHHHCQADAGAVLDSLDFF